MAPESSTASSEPGMIPGVYNYCDDWCEFCRVTTRCRSFEMRQALESRLDQRESAGAEMLTDTESMVAFTRELAKADGLATPGLDATLAGDPDNQFSLAPADEPLARQALAYAVASELLLAKTGWRPPNTLRLGSHPPPHNVVMWYHLFLAMKVRRALVAVHRVERGISSDVEEARGSAKIALISIDRSRSALEELCRHRPKGLARQLLVMLDVLGAALEARVPGARSFVRPGLDDREEGRSEDGPPGRNP